MELDIKQKAKNVNNVGTNNSPFSKLLLKKMGAKTKIFFSH